MNDKNYNATRDKLILPEYGRNVVSMVNELLRIENREERTRQAQIVIDVMGNINPTLRDSNDYKHKIWDHLFILSDFKLDIDAPYEIPSREELQVKPEKIAYVRHSITHKQYGNNVRETIDILCQNRDKEDIIPIAVDIAKFMKQKSFEYNKEYPSNEVVLNDIRKFSNGEIILDEGTLNNTSVNINKAVRPKISNTPQRSGNNTGSAKPAVRYQQSPLRRNNNTTKK
ncbi:MAG: DUF4290 domain-containing protein [Rikenellaceae bacterium]